MGAKITMQYTLIIHTLPEKPLNYPLFYEFDYKPELFFYLPKWYHSLIVNSIFCQYQLSVYFVQFSYVFCYKYRINPFFIMHIDFLMTEYKEAFI